MGEGRQQERLGAIALNADLGTGICEVELTSPYGIQTLVVKVPLIDLLESIAMINVGICRMQRQMFPGLRAVKG